MIVRWMGKNVTNIRGMNGKIIWIVLLFVAFTSWGQAPISSAFKLKWKADIGITCYRTNMILKDGIIYLGSNGTDRNSLDDSKDGVHAIDAKTGKTMRRYGLPYLGDNDVAGIAISGDRLFFGTDNYAFLCFDLQSGKEVWKVATPYDVESAPALADLNQDGTVDVVYTVEGNGIYARSGTDGSLIWLKDSVSAHGGNAAPKLVDLNGDGVQDVISSIRGLPNSDEIDGFKMLHYGDYHWALDGKTGRVLWMVPSGAGIHNTPFIYREKGNMRIALMDCYGEFKVVDSLGTVMGVANFGYGYFNSPVMTADQHVVLGNVSVDWRSELIEVETESGIPYLSGAAESNYVKAEGPISATTIVADVLGTGKQQLIGVTEQGILFIAETNGKEIKQYKLKKGAEASVMVADIDRDGYLELLIAELDGTLYCYATKSKGKVEYGCFGCK